MVPVDAKIATSADIPAQAVDVGAVVDAFKAAGNRMNIVVLDACRDNPFATNASGKGLAQLDAPPGTFLAFATAPGNVAVDGDTRSANGLYTGFLLEELKKPAARIEDVFKRVRLNVRKQSKGRQVPWESTSLEDDFVFNAGVKIAPRPEVADRERAFAQQKADWDRIKDSSNPDDLFAFLEKYPSGLISDLAQARLNALQRVAIVAQPGKGGAAGGSLTNVMRDGDYCEFEFRDGLTGIVTEHTNATLRQVGPDLFEASGQGTALTRVNTSGFVFRDAGGTFDPPWNVIPGGELVVGNRSAARSIRTSPSGDKIWLDIESRIVAQERITTPLGTLETFRVEVQFIGQTGFRTKLTFWYEPGWGYSVRMRRESRPRSGAADISIRDVVARSRKS
jgi:Caspase domain